VTAVISADEIRDILLHTYSAAKDGLAFTLMERLLERHKGHDNVIVRMLTTQYRMHDDIMRWSSEQMYQGRLVSHPSVASHLLK